MTRPELLDAIRRAADQPLEGFPRRRKGMDVETAERILAVVLDAIAPPIIKRVERDWSGNDVADMLREWRQTHDVATGRANGSHVVPRATLRTKGLTGHDYGCMCADCTGVLL